MQISRLDPKKYDLALLKEALLFHIQAMKPCDSETWLYYYNWKTSNMAAQHVFHSGHCRYCSQQSHSAQKHLIFQKKNNNNNSNYKIKLLYVKKCLQTVLWRMRSDASWELERHDGK